MATLGNVAVDVQTLDEIFPNARKPQLVCIGAQKAGTSWLYEVLRQHPDVWSPPFKELHFFDYKFIPECRNWAPWHVAKSIRNVVRNAKSGALNPDLLVYLEALQAKPMFNGTWYKRAFAPAPQNAVCMDITPEYSTLPEEGVAFATNFLGQAKFIYVIRDPLERALSQLRMNVSRRKQPPETPDDWMQEAQKPVILQRGAYKTYVPRWSQHLPDDRLLFLPYKDLLNTPDRALAEIEALAGLDAHSYASARKRVHVTPEVDVPEDCIAYLTEQTEEQRDFVASHFGRTFARRT